MYYNDFLDRFLSMLNSAQEEKLKNARVIVFGVGGVGGALCHFLVRSGVTQLDVVDFDTIDISNINRQLVAYSNNIGLKKVEELKKQLLQINPQVQIKTHFIKYSSDTQQKFNLAQYDIIADCIDDIPAKKLLILNAKAAKKYIISAMGAGNRYAAVPQFEVSDISKTSYDPIAKILRKFCAEQGIKKLDVCYTKQKAGKFSCNKISSVVYYPISMACCICAKIINKIVEGV